MQVAHAQSPSPSLVATAPGEVVGVLERGELLVMALKREKIDGNSIRLATQSISQIFDFRLSRAGDRYLYRLGSGRKLELLRYQRAQHIFEARLNSDGDYVSSLVDSKSGQAKLRENVVNPAPSVDDDDGEIDVESLALGQQMRQPPDVVENPPLLKPQDNTFLDQDDEENDFVDPNSPPQEEDPALAGRISPDKIDENGNTTYPNQNIDTLAPIIHDLDDTDKQGGRFGAIEDDKPLPESEIRPQFIEINSNNPSANAAKTQTKSERDLLYAPLINAVYALGALLFLLTAIIVLRRNLNVGARLRSGHLELKEKLAICEAQSLVIARYHQRYYLLSATQNKMTLLDVIGDEASAVKNWNRLKSQAYWHQMARKPMTDEELFAIIKDIDLKDSGELDFNSSETKPQYVDADAMVEELHVEGDDDELENNV